MSFSRIVTDVRKLPCKMECVIKCCIWGGIHEGEGSSVGFDSKAYLCIDYCFCFMFSWLFYVCSKVHYHHNPKNYQHPFPRVPMSTAKALDCCSPYFAVLGVGLFPSKWREQSQRKKSNLFLNRTYCVCVHACTLMWLWSCLIRKKIGKTNQKKYLLLLVMVFCDIHVQLVMFCFSFQSFYNIRSSL